MEAYNAIGLLDKSKLLEIFDYLNQQLKENVMQLELTIYGGCIMTMVYDNRPATSFIRFLQKLRRDRLMQAPGDVHRFGALAQASAAPGPSIVRLIADPPVTP